MDAAAAPLKTGSSGSSGWRRSWGTTVARAQVILLAQAAFLWWAGARHGAPAGEPAVAYFVERWWFNLGIFMIAYSVIAGVWIDHYLARRGFWVTGVAWVGGIVLTGPALVFTLAPLDPLFADWYDGVISAIGMFIVWPLQLAFEGVFWFLAAWLVPSSFPRQYRLFTWPWRRWRARRATRPLNAR